MKKSLKRKLIMSSIAVATAIVGTTASTYAWFVSNTDVTSSVTGNVASSDSSLYISKDSSSFSTKGIEFDFSDSKIAPLQAITKTGSTGFNFKHLNNETTVTEKEYIKYSIYFSVQNVSAAVPKTITMSMKADDKDYSKKEAQHVAQANVTLNGNYKEIQTGKKYWENVLKTLNMNISYVTDADATNLDTKDNSTLIGNYQINSTASQYDGLAYYKNVNGLDTLEKGADVLEVSDTISSNNIDNVDGNNLGQADGKINLIANITAAGYYKVDFTIWLDGWDDAAFDAVASHTFGMEFTFGLE